MLHIVMLFVLIFFVSFISSIFGKGGGDLYVPSILSIVDIPYHNIAGVSLFLVFFHSMSMLTVYSGKHKLVDWPLGLSVAAFISVFSFIGGYTSKFVNAFYLKIIFIAFLLVSGALMLLSVRRKLKFDFGPVLKRKLGKMEYTVRPVPMLMAICLFAFISSMIGMAGGGLILSSSILFGGIPTRIAIGINTLLVLISSLFGFSGHVAQGTVDWNLAFILGIAVLLGSQLGSRAHAKISERNLRKGLFLILILAAVWMSVHLFLHGGN